MAGHGSSNSLTGIVKSVASRSERRQPMVEAQSCMVRAGMGLVDENRPQSKRQITLLSTNKWADVCKDLDKNLPWHTRRANLLIEGADLSETLGKKIHIGSVQIQIHAETRPCELMDYLHKGLRDAMKPSLRGGVYGEVLTDGTISVGDQLTIDGD